MFVWCSFAVQSMVGHSIFGYDIRNNLSPYVNSLIFRLEALLAGIRGSPLEVT